MNSVTSPASEMSNLDSKTILTICPFSLGAALAYCLYPAGTQCRERVQILAHRSGCKSRLFLCTPAKWRWGAEKYGVGHVGKNTVFHAEKKIPRVKTIKSKQGYQRQNRGTNRGTKRLLKIGNLASMRVSRHHSSDFTPYESRI